MRENLCKRFVCLGSVVIPLLESKSQSQLPQRAFLIKSNFETLAVVVRKCGKNNKNVLFLKSEINVFAMFPSYDPSLSN